MVAKVKIMYLIVFDDVEIFNFIKIIEPEAGPPFTRYNSSLHNALL